MFVRDQRLEVIYPILIANYYLSNLLLFFGKNTVDEEEIEKLSRTTSDWWNPNGDFCALHSMNKLRVPFIKKSLEHLHTQDFTPSKPLRGSRILDVGCGGGILSEVYFSNNYSRAIGNLKEKNYCKLSLFFFFLKYILQFQFTLFRLI